MQSFLQLVANDLYAKLKGDIARVVIIFPNKRANLFFNEYLAIKSGRPLWAPVSMTISKLFDSLSNLKTGDTIQLVCELYEAFRAETGTHETLDDFYFWGELLISDFDDLDKNLVDNSKLFSNLQDLRHLTENQDFLDKEQEEAIQQFFRNFSIEKQTELKERFISLWEKLDAVYQHFKKNLKQIGIAYEGMLYRDAIEHLDLTRLKYDRYVFVGFNVLNKVETRLMHYLKDAGKAMFYWDYDVFYTYQIGKHEAGEFIRRNLQEFPNELPESCFDAMRLPKHIRYISASTENAQARFLPEWIRETFRPEDEEKENAVVLCNEDLLLPVLHSIPEEVKNVNVTMGFPLVQTPVYSLINAIMELQVDGYRKDTGRFAYDAVAAVLKHPYIQHLSSIAETLEKELAQTNRFYPLPSELKRDSLLSKLFTCHSTPTELCQYLLELIKEVSVLYRDESTSDNIFNQLYRESLFQSYTKINRLYGLIEMGNLTVRVDTLKKLIAKVLSSTNIPFHGEPAIGMQIMGVLETRNLDFRNILILSLNEGKLPKSGGDSSFIPYNLRKAFGMTTIEHKNAVYAYYFYRLIQRAETVTLLYNTSSDGLNRGEWSRFMLQLLIEGTHPIERKYLEARQSPQATSEVTVEKSLEVIEKLMSAYDASSSCSSILSPSALNTYLDCRLKFYFSYVARLRIPDEVSAEIDSALFGTIFHRSAQLAYQRLTTTGNLISKDDIDRLLRNEIELQAIVDQAFKEKLFKAAPHERPTYNGTQLINLKVVLSYLKQLLRNDRKYAPFEMIDMERPIEEKLTIHTSRGPFTLRLGGTVDRIDRQGDTIRIVDYKTGGIPKVPANIEQLFTPSVSRPGYVFQTFLYASIISHTWKMKVAPALLYIHKAASEQYSPVIVMGEPRKPKIPINDFSLFEQEFRRRLSSLIEEIYNETIPFTQTENTSKCDFCDFKAICRR